MLIFFFQPSLFFLNSIVHEMAHVWNHLYGTPTRIGYHSKVWAKKMVEIGLQPVSYDRENSATGYSVDHQIIENGRFQQVARGFLGKGFSFNWQSAKTNNAVNSSEKILCAEKQEDLSKTKFSCVACNQAAWAKSTAHLVCGHCGKRMLSKWEINDSMNKINN